MEIQIRLSDAELMRLNDSRQKPPKCSAKLHNIMNMLLAYKRDHNVTLWTAVCMPIVFLMSICIAFYYGAVTWYNIYLYVTEETHIWQRILLGPFLVLSFPFLIVTSSFGLGLYCAIIQLSWFLPHWYQEVSDFEKGFHGWLCSYIQLPECSPCQIVILDDEVVGLDHSGQGAMAEAQL